MNPKIRTFTPPKEGRSCDWTLEPWKPGQKLMVSPWQKGQRPYRRGQRVRFPFNNRWSFGCGSVFNWINNGVYSCVVPDTTNPDVYFLIGGEKFCAGVVTPKQDILIDHDWYYYIKGLEMGERKTKDDGKTLRHIQHSWTFTIDSLPYDVPAVVQHTRERDSKQYMGAWKIGDFEITISHADPSKKRWLSRAVTSDIEKELTKLFQRSTEEYRFEL